MVRLVLFDIDGTLIRSGGAGEKAFARVCEMEFKVTNGTAKLHFAGRTDPSIVREFFNLHRIEPTQENFQRFFDCYVFMLDHLLGQLDGAVLPGVSKIIHNFCALPQPPVLGLLTGNIRLGAQVKLNHCKLWDEFVTGGFADDHEDRNQIAAIARDRGSRISKRKLRGEEILVIGDTPLDVACAKAIEAKSLAVATGSYRVDQLREHTPTWAVDSLEGLRVEEFCL